MEENRGASLRSTAATAPQDYLVEALATFDAFDYGRISESIVRAIRTAEAPFVYAICGSWGSGKSSLLGQIIDRLPGPVDGGLVIYFNAWRASAIQDVRSAFLWDLAEQLREIPKAAERLENETETQKVLELVVESAVYAMSEGGAAAKFFAELHKRAKQKEEELVETQQRVAASRLLQSKFEIIGTAVRDAGLVPFVIVDELDRCPPHDVVRTLEALAMFLANSDELADRAWAKNTNGEQREGRSPFRFLVAMDEEYVVNAFRKTYGLSIHEAFAYISKFIQFRYHFPAKSWETFYGHLVNAYGDPKFFLKSESGELRSGQAAQIAEAFRVQSPRDARQVLGYLLHWQERVYLPGEDVADRPSVIRTIEEQLGSPDLLGQTVAAMNDLLLIFAAVKVVVPEFVGQFIEKDVLNSIAASLWTVDVEIRDLMYSPDQVKRFESVELSRFNRLIDGLEQARSAIVSAYEPQSSAKAPMRKALQAGVDLAFRS